MKNEENKKKKKTFLVVVFLLLFVLSSGFGIFAAMNPGIFFQSAENSTAGNTKWIDENGNAIDGALQNKSPDEILKELQEKQINVTDKLSSHIFFPDSKAGTEGQWVVENVEANMVAIQCEVYLGDRMIAKSVPIKPNQHIETIILSEDVEPGEYDVIAYINYFSIDSGDYLAKAGFKVKLTVQ